MPIERKDVMSDSSVEEMQLRRIVSDIENKGKRDLLFYAVDKR